MKFEMGDRIRDARHIDRVGMVVKASKSYLDVYFPSIRCVMMCPAEEAQFVSSSNYECKCFVCGQPVRGAARVELWGGDEKAPVLVHEECVREE